MTWLYDKLAPPVASDRLPSVRILVGLYSLIYLLIRTPSFVRLATLPASSFEPVGLAHLVPTPVSGVTFGVAAALTLVLGVSFTVGYRYRWVAPAYALFLLGLLSYRNSFGMVFHTENLMVLHVAALALSPAARALSIDARNTAPRAATSRADGLALQVLNVATVTAYFLAGVAKVRASGFNWATGEILRNQIAFDNVRKDLLGDSHSPFAEYVVGHASLFIPFAVLTLVIELLAPLALFHRRLGHVWAVLMWSFHFGILLLMWILFPYPLSFIAFIPLFAPERFLGPWVRRLTSRWAPRAREGATS